jgi:hypothetical protein
MVVVKLLNVDFTDVLYSTLSNISITGSGFSNKYTRTETSSRFQLKTKTDQTANRGSEVTQCRILEKHLAISCNHNTLLLAAKNNSVSIELASCQYHTSTDSYDETPNIF